MRRAVTLIELLVVIAIIATLTGVSLVVVPILRFNARAYDTSQRLQQVTTGLVQYGGGEGSTCAALQQVLPLGGVPEFASVKIVLNRIGFDGGLGERSTNGPNRWPDNWSRDAKYDSQKGIWRRLRADTFEAVPTPAQHSQTWYLQAWPTHWPESDWDREPPGAIPPLLRFPWGRPGLRHDGTACDPVLTAGAELPGTVFDGNGNPITSQVFNSWATHRASGGGDALQFAMADNAQTSAVTSPVTVTRSSGIAESIPSNQPLPFDLGRCSPLRTVDLLRAAGILPAGSAGPIAYRSDRSRNKRWNDAWGRPLVVTYALFQPERYTRLAPDLANPNDDFDLRDRLLKSALTTYQYNRALYVSAAAIGPTLRAASGVSPWDQAGVWPLAQDDRALRAMWLQVRENTRAWEWSEGAWTVPAWTGVRIGLGSERCFVSAPVEIK